MNQQLTISIGVPALNEELNIVRLLNSMVGQELNDAQILEILVISDGSTDRTNELVKNFNHPLVRLIENPKRQGQQAVQNQMLQIFKGDCLLIIEADTLPANPQTVSELIRPLLEDKVGDIGMVVGETMTFRPENFFEKILFHNTALKKRMFAEWKNGDNIYNSGGHSGRLFSKTFTKSLTWPVDVPEDAFAYLRLKQLHLRLVKQKNALMIARNVRNLTDRLRQGSKFANGRQTLTKHFSNAVVNSEYNIPLNIMIKQTFLGFLKNPFWTTLAVMELAVTRLLSFGFRKEFNALYTPYVSSKDLEEKTHV